MKFEKKLKEIHQFYHHNVLILVKQVNDQKEHLWHQYNIMNQYKDIQNL